MIVGHEFGAVSMLLLLYIIYCLFLGTSKENNLVNQNPKFCLIQQGVKMRKAKLNLGGKIKKIDLCDYLLVEII